MEYLGTANTRYRDDSECSNSLLTTLEMQDCALSDLMKERPVMEPTSAISVETVLSVKHWNEHLFTFRITRPASFRFRSGEFVMIGLPGENGKPLLRAYSIASPS